MRSNLSLCLVAGALAAIPAFAQESAVAVHAKQHMNARVFELGLDRSHSFALKNEHQDEFGDNHVRMNQFFNGVRVFEGETIVHMKNGVVRDRTDALARGLRVNVKPALEESEALAVAHAAFAPKGAYVVTPTAELVIFKGRLAYNAHLEVENELDTRHMDYMIDAHSGAILKSWSSLCTAKPVRGGGGSTTGIVGTAAVGTGNSQYSGTVSLNTTKTSLGTYAMQDMVRGSGGLFGHNAVTNLNHATSGNGTIYQSDADNVWGDGANYVEGSTTTAANGQTAAVDAAFGVAATWDMFGKVLGRNGIDGTGKATYLRVHYSNSYDNAFWSDSCFCMTFGDGNSFKTLTSIDVAGHEMTHGVCATTAKLTYSGESGGLNEANSDIMGAMVEFYGQGGGLAAGATTIPNTGGNFDIGEQLATASYNHPLRYMYKPSLDGSSPDFWKSTLGTLDVHYSSGVGNHFFYLLSQGTSAKTNTYNNSTIVGIGNDKAARIWFRALATYFTSSTNYAAARVATLKAATDLYGAGSTEYNTVAAAWTAVNVN